MTGVVPATPQIPAGWYPVQADFNAWVTTPFQFLTTKAVFRAQLQGTQALAASSFTLAHLDTILEDPYGGWSATLTANQPAWSWLCPPGCSGWYDISLTGSTASQGSTPSSCGAALWVSGTEYAQTSLSPGVNGNTSASSGSVQVPLTGGSDYVQMYIYSLAAVNTPATAGRYPSMEVTWLSS